MSRHADEQMHSLNSRERSHLEKQKAPSPQEIVGIDAFGSFLEFGLKLFDFLVSDYNKKY
jgi:hypothetical protein